MKPKEECKVILTEEDVEEENKEEIERNEEKAQQWEKHSQVEIQQETLLINWLSSKKDMENMINP